MVTHIWSLYLTFHYLSQYFDTPCSKLPAIFKVWFLLTQPTFYQPSHHYFYSLLQDIRYFKCAWKHKKNICLWDNISFRDMLHQWTLWLQLSCPYYSTLSPSSLFHSQVEDSLIQSSALIHHKASSPVMKDCHNLIRIRKGSCRARTPSIHHSCSWDITTRHGLAPPVSGILPPRTWLCPFYLLSSSSFFSGLFVHWLHSFISSMWACMRYCLLDRVLIEFGQEKKR